jgi:hypothetical protein
MYVCIYVCMYVCMYVYTYIERYVNVCMYVCIYVCTYVLRPNETTHAVYYVLAAVFASCFYVLKILFHE